MSQSLSAFSVFSDLSALFVQAKACMSDNELDKFTSMINYIQRCRADRQLPRKVWVWVGDGGNGKSTTLRLLCDRFNVAMFDDVHDDSTDLVVFEGAECNGIDENVLAVVNSVDGRLYDLVNDTHGEIIHFTTRFSGSGSGNITA